MIQGTFGMIQGTLGMIPGTLGMLPGTFGMIQGTLGMIQGTFGMIQGTLGMIQGTFGMIQGTFGMIQRTLGTSAATERPSECSAWAVAKTWMAAERRKEPCTRGGGRGTQSTHWANAFIDIPCNQHLGDAEGTLRAHFGNI
jgi:hypothetical protein